MVFLQRKYNDRSMSSSPSSSFPSTSSYPSSFGGEYGTYQSENEHGMNMNIKKKSWKQTPIMKIIQYAALVIGIATNYTTTSKLSNHTQELSVMNERRNSLYEQYVLKEKDLQEVHDDFSYLNLQLNTMYSSMMTMMDSKSKTKSNLKLEEDENHEISSGTSRKLLTDTMLVRTGAQKERVESMENAIQQGDREYLENKYGAGPYLIEVAVLIHGDRQFFTIETAPNHLMPHSVRLFMDLAERNFWDSTLMYHQLQHIAVVIPITVQGVRKHANIATTLIFPEYSEEYVHSEFTVGFQGFPAGPDFYINLEDNTDHHGPSETQPDGTFRQGDPCFGKIIHGEDVARRFRSLSVEAANSKRGVKYSSIETMRIVKK